jgi:hypothetical protein
VEGRAHAHRRRSQCGKNFLSNFIAFVVERGARLWYCCAAFSYLRETPISISPNALLTVFALLAAVTLGIGIGFAALGAWLVLPFAGAEVIGLAIAFVAVARRAARQQERIER